MRLADQPAPNLTKQCVVFVTLRHGRPSVVANGVYRVAQNGTILGYAQEINPGGYELQPKHVYRSLDELTKEIDIAQKKMPQQQADLMRAVSSAKTPYEFRDKLHRLAEITCAGDAKVVAFAAAGLDRGGEREAHYLGFLHNLPDRAILPVLIKHFEKGGGMSTDVLYAIALQANPAASEFLEATVRSGTKKGVREVAYHALHFLYLRLEAAEDEPACDKVRSAIFRLFDEVPLATDHAILIPEILSAIPHPGALARLELLLKRFEGVPRGHASRFQDALDECRKKIEAKKSKQ